MLQPSKYKYVVALKTEKGKQYDITDFIENLVWEEQEKELATRITFSAKNDKTSKGRLSALAKPGCYVGILYSYKGGKNKEATRGKIVEWNPSAKASAELFKVKAYDCLYDMQESSDNIYFDPGIMTKSAITQICNSWKIPLSKYAGPNVTHDKLVYKNEKLGSVLLKILKKAKKKGGNEALLRAVKNKVQVLEYGSNTKIYHFAQSENLISVSHKISTVGMVTRVKVIGEEDDDGRRPIEATVDGRTKYGIRQKIVTRGSDDSLDEAKKEAQEILDEDGKPVEEITVKSPDIPIIRKGDKIHLKMATGSGYYWVMAVTHDCDSMTMQMDLKKAKERKSTSSKKKKSNYQVGDVVDFHGGKHYVSSYAGATGYPVAAGKAKITIANGSGKVHPWHLITQNWSQTHVYGWVDDGSFD